MSNGGGTGVTSLNISFYVGFCFVVKEDFEHYEFVLLCLDVILSRLGLARPRTIMMTAFFGTTRVRWPRKFH
jgi:hypothetical protein